MGDIGKHLRALDLVPMPKDEAPAELSAAEREIPAEAVRATVSQ